MTFTFSLTKTYIGRVSAKREASKKLVFYNITSGFEDTISNHHQKQQQQQQYSQSQIQSYLSTVPYSQLLTSSSFPPNTLGSNCAFLRSIETLMTHVYIYNYHTFTFVCVRLRSHESKSASICIQPWHIHSEIGYNPKKYYFLSCVHLHHDPPYRVTYCMYI